MVSIVIICAIENLSEFWCYEKCLYIAINIKIPMFLTFKSPVKYEQLCNSPPSNNNPLREAPILELRKLNMHPCAYSKRCGSILKGPP